MGFFRTAFYMPVVMSAVVVGMIWTNLLDSAGLVNSVLKALKIISKPIPFLTDRWGVLFSSMFVTIWLGLGYYMVIYLTALANIMNPFTKPPPSTALALSASSST